MSTINPSLASYLSNLSNNSSGSDTSLADALAGVNKTSNSPTGGAKSAVSSDDMSYLLSLSEEARNYLTSQAAKPADDSKDSDAKSFILSIDQQQKLNQIIAKYKDAPFTQATFDAMLEELGDAGLAPDQMAAKDQMRQINPTQSLLDALNGATSSTLPGTVDTSGQKAKGDAYLKAIFNQWESISTTAGTADDESA